MATKHPFIALPTDTGSVYYVRVYDITLIQQSLDAKTTNVVIMAADTPVTITTTLPPAAIFDAINDHYAYDTSEEPNA